MNTVYPNFYHLFKCIAEKCKHNCCIGWEIDVDENTYQKYKNEKSKFKNTLLENIGKNENGYFFKLTENERCPFLEDDGLCKIIKNLGENSLCQICTDHPRYRNFFESTTETGLGLCCEEVARIILNFKEKQNFIGEYILTDEEKFFIKKRKAVLDIIQDREIPVCKRVEKIKNIFSINTGKDFYSVFGTLEMLDKNWQNEIEKLKQNDCDFSDEFDLPFEQILSYFIFRHTYENFEEGILFSIVSFEAIGKIFFGSENKTLENLAEICRMYSSEIEYSDENIEKIADYFR